MVLSQETYEHIEASVRLKKRLIKYFWEKENKFMPQLKAKYKRSLKTESDIINAIDWFVHCYRFRNGDTFIDRFIKGHKDLLELEINILDRWKESLVGIFEVKSIEDDVIMLFNMLDEAVYIATTNAGKQILSSFQPRNFIITRLVPLDDIYLLSGEQKVLPPEAKDQLVELATSMVKSNFPMALGHNKEKIQKGWESQQKRRKEFIAFFGNDLIVVHGYKVAKIVEDFISYCNETSLSKMPENERVIYKNYELKSNIPEELTLQETVGIIFDEVEGLNFYPDFHKFIAPFKDPVLIADEECQEVIMGYLWSDTISTLPFKRMVELYPQNASKVFAKLLNHEGWNNNKDFDKLMQKYKGLFLKKKSKPGVVQVSQEMLSTLHEE